jgi:hypothetical protein
VPANALPENGEPGPKLQRLNAAIRALEDTNTKKIMLEGQRPVDGTVLVYIQVGAHLITATEVPKKASARFALRRPTTPSVIYNFGLGARALNLTTKKSSSRF